MRMRTSGYTDLDLVSDPCFPFNRPFRSQSDPKKRSAELSNRSLKFLSSAHHYQRTMNNCDAIVVASEEFV